MKTFNKWKNALRKLVPPPRRRRTRDPADIPQPPLAVEIVQGRRTVRCSVCDLHLWVPTQTTMVQPKFLCGCGEILLDPMYHSARDRVTSHDSTSTVTTTNSFPGSDRPCSPQSEDEQGQEKENQDEQEGEDSNQGKRKQGEIEEEEEHDVVFVTMPLHTTTAETFDHTLLGTALGTTDPTSDMPLHTPTAETFDHIEHSIPSKEGGKGGGEEEDNEATVDPDEEDEEAWVFVAEVVDVSTMNNEQIWITEDHFLTDEHESSDEFALE